VSDNRLTKQIRISQLREAVEAGNHVTLYPGAAAELLAEIDGLRSHEPSAYQKRLAERAKGKPIDVDEIGQPHLKETL